MAPKCAIFRGCAPRSSTPAARAPRCARAYPGEDPQSIKEPAAVGAFVAKLMVEGFDSTAYHALPKVMADA